MKLYQPIILFAFAAEKCGLAKTAETSYRWTAESFDSRDAWFRLGRMASEKNEWDKAIDHYKHAVRCGQDDAESYFKLGFCQMKRRLWNDAEANIGIAIKLDPYKRQWLAQYNEALGKQGKKPAAAKDQVLPDRDFDSLTQLLKIQTLAEEFAQFDTLHALIVSAFKIEDPFVKAQLAVLEAERHASEGNHEMAASIAGILEDDDSHGYYLKGLIHYMAGDYTACVDRLQEFLADYPREQSAVRLMARAARLSDNPEIAWRALCPLLEGPCESATWLEASLLVTNRSDFNRLFRRWSAFRKTYKITPYYMKVARHVAAAAANSGNLVLARKLLSECGLAVGKRRMGPPTETHDIQNHPEYKNLPDTLIPLEGVEVISFGSVSLRWVTAMGALVDLLDDGGFIHSAVRRTLALIMKTDNPPTLHDGVEFGIFGEEALDKAYALLTANPGFLVSESLEPNATVMRFKHINGISLKIFLHTESNGKIIHGCDGIEWSNKLFSIERVEFRDRKVPVPADPDAYLADFFGENIHLYSEADFRTLAGNMSVTNDKEFVISLHDWFLECAMLGDDAGMMKCMQRLSDVGERDFVRKAYGERDNYVDANLPQLLVDRPQVILYLSGLENVAYQGNMWIPVLEKLSARCAIVIRERRIASQLLKTRLPIYYFESLRELEYLEQAGIRTILYPANAQKATQSLRLHRINHYFINHGESDKVVNQSKFLMAYDKLLVAGPLAERRLRSAGLPVRDEQVVHVGRPQTELALRRVSSKAIRVKTVFYAPTWEGFNESANYSSVNDYGLRMLETLAACPDYRILFKPHPYTGQSNPNEAGAFLKKMMRLTKGRRVKFVDATESIFDCMNESDLLVTDVSSVLNDYLYTLKPMIITNPNALAHETMRSEYPSSAATYILDRSEEIVGLIERIVMDDSMFGIRQSVSADSLGDFPLGSLAEFDRVIQASLEG